MSMTEDILDGTPVVALPEDNRDFLPWFHQLTVDEQLQLLRHPLADIPEELAEKLERFDDVISYRWEDDEKVARLLPEISTPLRELRTQFYMWWEELAEVDQTYVMDHRDRRFEEDWREEIESAGGPVIRIVVEPDGFDANSFELTPLLRLYVEHRARALRAKDEKEQKERPARPAIRTRPSGTDSAMMPASQRPQGPPPRPPLPDMFR